jgi:cAMP-dependent protein kinase regulator
MRPDEATIRALRLKAADALEGGVLDVASAAYLEIVRLSPDDLVARQRAAELLGKLGRAEKAIAHYRHLVGRYAADGQLLKAIATCKQILELDPTHEATQATLADLFARHDSRPSPAVVPSTMAGAIPRRATLPFMPRAPSIPRVEPERAAHARAHDEPHAAAPRAPTRRDSTVEFRADAPVILEVDALARIPLFSDLPREAFLGVLERVRLRVVRAGEAIVREGEEGHAMFAVAQGAVRVERRMASGVVRTLAQIGEGSFFGEMALLGGGSRLATVTAVHDCVLLEFERDQLDQICIQHPRVREVIEQFYKTRLLYNLLRASAVFHHLDDRARQQVVDGFHFHAIAKGHVLLEQGRPGDAFYVLLRGICEVVHQRGDGGEIPYPQMREGDVFGELSLLHGIRVTATVRAFTPCVVLSLERSLFDELVLSNPEARAAISRLALERLERTQGILASEGLSLEDMLI